MQVRNSSKCRGVGQLENQFSDQTTLTKPGVSAGKNRRQEDPPATQLRLGGDKVNTTQTLNKSQTLNGLLADLQSSSGDIEACAVASEDGLIIASALPQGLEETRVAAMSATMLSMGTRAAAELARGEMSQILIKGTNGFVVLMQAGPNAVLVAIARKDAKLGLIFYDLDRSAAAIGDVLS